MNLKSSLYYDYYDSQFVVTTLLFDICSQIIIIVEIFWAYWISGDTINRFEVNQIFLL